MAQLFRRKAKLLVAIPVGDSLTEFRADVYEIEDLRLRFRVVKTLRKEPNTAEVTVTNLSQRSRAELQDKAFRVTLQAGYADTIATVFIGDARDVDSRRAGPDWETKIQAGDGERGYRHGRVSESFKGGTSVAAVVRKFAQGMGVDVATASGFLGELAGKQFVTGYTAHGRASRELDRLLRRSGYEWSVQDGKLLVAKPDAAGFESAVELSPDTGMVDSPEMASPEKKGGKPTLRIKSLLQPTLLPGSKVVVRSTQHKGAFKIKKVTHTGDTAGGEFYSELEAEPE